MEEIIIYEAEDGTRFEDYNQCYNYEFRKIIDKAGYVMFDSKFNKLDNYEMRSYESAYFMNLPTMTDRDLMLEVFDLIGLALSPDEIPEPGLYLYDERDSEFKNLGMIYAGLEKVRDTLLGKHYHCPVNGWDCLYYKDKDEDDPEHCCLCTMDNPYKGCSDFFSQYADEPSENYTDYKYGD